MKPTSLAFKWTLPLLLFAGCFQAPAKLDPRAPKVLAENMFRSTHGMRQISPTWIGYRVAGGEEHWSKTLAHDSADKTITRSPSGNIAEEKDTYASGRAGHTNNDPDADSFIETLTIRYNYGSGTAELFYDGDNMDFSDRAFAVSGKSLTEVHRVADEMLKPWGMARQ